MRRGELVNWLIGEEGNRRRGELVKMVVDFFIRVPQISKK